MCNNCNQRRNGCGCNRCNCGCGFVGLLNLWCNSGCNRCNCGRFDEYYIEQYGLWNDEFFVGERRCCCNRDRRDGCGCNNRLGRNGCGCGCND